MNRIRVCGAATLLLAIIFLFAKSAVSSAVCAQRQKTTRSNTIGVGDLFRTNCARCHGADGRGDTPLGQTYNAPDFTDANWWRRNASTTTRGKLLSLVTNGKGEMPAFEKKLTRHQIESLVDYVRRFRGSN
ncbi:MAG TPA: cytochrome c [Pyrinomonadaceae bacterium]|jgi:mono/diheme cytochrome c family protein|nr:cytochrome c [Pyrinomonadaceae bacterium]